MADGSRWASGLAFVVLAFSCLISQAEAGSYCTTNYYSSTTYCSSGCCGSGGREYCCDVSITWAVVVGCVMGGLFLLSVVVVVVCMVIKKKGRPGRVVQPGVTPNNNVTVVYTGNTPQYPGPPPAYGAQPMGAQPMPLPPPPAYPHGSGTTPYPPTVFSYNDPTNPPPSAKY